MIDDKCRCVFKEGSLPVIEEKIWSKDRPRVPVYERARCPVCGLIAWELREKPQENIART